jgi:hypothetical protein
MIPALLLAAAWFAWSLFTDRVDPHARRTYWEP